MNNLYIYPTALSIAKGAGVSARNIGLSIKLLENDDDPSAAGLKVSTWNTLCFLCYQLEYNINNELLNNVWRLCMAEAQLSCLWMKDLPQSLITRENQFSLMT